MRLYDSWRWRSTRERVAGFRSMAASVPTSGPVLSETIVLTAPVEVRTRDDLRAAAPSSGGPLDASELLEGVGRWAGALFFVNIS